MFLIGRNAHDAPLAGALWQVSGGSEERPPLICSILSYRLVPYPLQLAPRPINLTDALMTGRRELLSVASPRPQKSPSWRLIGLPLSPSGSPLNWCLMSERVRLRCCKS